jgi:hypothetical protein
LRGPRFRRRRNRDTVEALALRIAELVVQRQELRRANAPVTELERNRIQIARLQWELAHALIDRYMPAEPARSAA